MDKNTLIGALLIGAVLIGFTWFSKPDPTQSPAPSPQDTTQLVTQAPAPAAGATVADSASLDSLGAPVLPPYLQPAQERIVELKNEKLSVKLSTKGGAPVEAVLADYLDQSKKPVHLFRKGDARLDLPLRTLENRLVSTADANFSVVESTDSTAVLRMQIDDVAYLDYAYKLRPADVASSPSISLYRISSGHSASLSRSSRGSSKVSTAVSTTTSHREMSIA